MASRRMAARFFLITVVLAGAFWIPSVLIPVMAQIKEMTVGPDGRPIKVTPYSSEDYEGLIPKGTESRGDAVRRLQAHKPDPVKYPVPRTTWDGKPNFTGVYWPAATMAQPPGDLLSLMRPEALAIRKTLDPADFPGQHCWPSSPTNGGTTLQQAVQMVHAPGFVVMINEYMGNYRIIPTDGRAHDPNARASFQGNSVGHWEGDTLVVDVTYFRERRKFSEQSSDALHIVEHWRLSDGRTLEYENVIEDPKILTQRWVGPKLRRGRVPYDNVLESICLQDQVLFEVGERERRYREFETKKAQPK